jgi:hypothetical protein
MNDNDCKNKNDSCAVPWYLKELPGGPGGCLLFILACAFLILLLFFCVYIFLLPQAIGKPLYKNCPVYFKIVGASLIIVLIILVKISIAHILKTISQWIWGAIRGAKGSD